MKAIQLLLSLFLLASGEAEEVHLSDLQIGGRHYKDVRVSKDSRLTAKIIHSEGVKRVPAESLPSEIQQKLGLLAVATEEPSGEIIASKRTETQLREDFRDAVKLNRWDQLQKAEVVQTVDIGKLVKIDGGDELLMLLGDREPRADGAVFSCIAQDTGKTFQYVTVLGAAKTVRMFVAYKPVDFNGFIKRLKYGDAIKVREVAYSSLCGVCEGRPQKCDKCEGTGLIQLSRTVVARWE